MAIVYKSMDMENHYEVWNGVQVARDPAAVPHEQVVGRLYLILMGYADRHDAGIVLLSNTAVHADGDCADYVMPDLTYVSKARMRLVKQNGVFGPPDLTVEVVSPGLNNAKRDIVDKFRLYERNGVQEYWMIDYVEREIQLFGLVDGKYERIGQSAVLPGIELPPETIFRSIDY